MESYGGLWYHGRQGVDLPLHQQRGAGNRQVGLNVSRVSENALIEAIGRLSEPKREAGLGSRAGVEGRGRDLNPFANLAVTCRLCEEIVPRNHQIRAKLKQTELWLSCDFGFDVGFSIRE